MNIKIIKCIFCKNTAEWELDFTNDKVLVCSDCVGGFSGYRKRTIESIEILKQEQELFKRR